MLRMPNIKTVVSTKTIATAVVCRYKIYSDGTTSSPEYMTSYSFAPGHKKAKTKTKPKSQPKLVVMDDDIEEY